jgi:plastocyanin
MRTKRLAMSVLALGLLAAACGGNKPNPSGGGGGGEGGGGGGGTKVSETAKNIAYGSTSLSAPGNAAFTIVFDNQDAGTPHNIDIFSDEAMTQSVFKGEVITGPAKADYNVPALQPGTYHFHCDVHPTQMEGTLTVS